MKPSTTRSLPPSRSTLSLERRLPLLMTALLALALGVSLALTYATLAGSARAAANDRLHRAVQQLAATSAQGVQMGLGATGRTIASDSAVVRVLRGDLRDSATTMPAVRRALGRLVVPADSSLPTELWTADGRRVTWLGADVRTGGMRAGEADPEPLTPGSDPAFTALVRSDSVRVTSLYPVGKRVFYWVVLPLSSQGKRIGYAVLQRELRANPQAARTIRELSSDAVTAYYRDADRPFWASIGGAQVDAPARVDSSDDGVVVSRPGAPGLLTAERRIDGTPLILVLEAPLSTVVGVARRPIVRLAVISLMILLVGALIAWGISRRITRPLVSLTVAAESVATGDFATRVEIDRGDEIGRLARSFNRMAEEIGRSQRELQLRTAQAQGASRAKSDFLATMSHELRTPLNAIAGYVDLIEMELRGPVTEEQRRDLSRIRAAQQHLLGLISGILDLSRIESGTVTYQVTPLAVEPFLAGLDALVAPQAANKALTLTHAPSPPELGVLADRERLRQVLLNLLSNAIRYTAAGGTIVLGAAPTTDGRVAISVRDTGVGIPREKLEEIFEPFVQLDRSLTKSPEGIGLGLAISRDLARGMGGDITAESTPGKGSCFTIVLPRTTVAADATELATTSGETKAVVR